MKKTITLILLLTITGCGEPTAEKDAFFGALSTAGYLLSSYAEGYNSALDDDILFPNYDPIIPSTNWYNPPDTGFRLNYGSHRGITWDDYDRIQETERLERRIDRLGRYRPSLPYKGRGSSLSTPFDPGALSR